MGGARTHFVDAYECVIHSCGEPHPTKVTRYGTSDAAMYLDCVK